MRLTNRTVLVMANNSRAGVAIVALANDPTLAERQQVKVTRHFRLQCLQMLHLAGGSGGNKSVYIPDNSLYKMCCCSALWGSKTRLETEELSVAEAKSFKCIHPKVP
jgi:hypothetical protein